MEHTSYVVAICVNDEHADVLQKAKQSKVGREDVDEVVYAVGRVAKSVFVLHCFEH